MPKDGTATRVRILDAAERLIAERGLGNTSVDSIITASGTSKGAFFHHFSSKAQLAGVLVARVAEADLRQLDEALKAISAVNSARSRLISFLRHFETRAETLALADAGCLYVSVLTERQLVDTDASRQIQCVIRTWRKAIATLVVNAFAEGDRTDLVDADALADHVFVTFEGAYLLCRCERDPSHLRAQLSVVRRLLEQVLLPGGAPLLPSNGPVHSEGHPFNGDLDRTRCTASRSGTGPGAV